MPICLTVDDLRPGMKLYQAVCNDFVVLLPPGKILDQRDVDALRRKYPSMHIMVANPLLDDVCDFQDDSKDRETAREAQYTMSQALGKDRYKTSGNILWVVLSDPENDPLTVTAVYDFTSQEFFSIMALHIPSTGLPSLRFHHTLPRCPFLPGSLFLQYVFQA